MTRFKSIIPIGLITLLGFILSSCSNNETASYENEEGSREVGNGYTNGIYCANIEYYYPKTGTNSTYVLQVEVENNELVKIHWPNGGWLDDSHFTPPDISDGRAEFSSDKGVDYTVTLLDSGADCNISNPTQEEDQVEEVVEGENEN